MEVEHRKSNIKNVCSHFGPSSSNLLSTKLVPRKMSLLQWHFDLCAIPEGPFKGGILGFVNDGWLAKHAFGGNSWMAHSMECSDVGGNGISVCLRLDFDYDHLSHLFLSLRLAEAEPLYRKALEGLHMYIWC